MAYAEALSKTSQTSTQVQASWYLNTSFLLLDSDMAQMLCLHVAAGLGGNTHADLLVGRDCCKRGQPFRQPGSNRETTNKRSPKNLHPHLPQKLYLHVAAGLRGQACAEALVAWGAEGRPPHQGIPEPVVEGAQAGACQVGLAGVAAPLVAGHLRTQGACEQYVRGGLSAEGDEGLGSEGSRSVDSWSSQGQKQWLGVNPPQSTWLCF